MWGLDLGLNVRGSRGSCYGFIGDGKERNLECGWCANSDRGGLQ